MKVFTNEELRNIIVAILVMSVIFWIYVFSFPDYNWFFVSLIIVFFSFFLHEMGHKFVARKLGCMATYKIWPTGLLIGIITIFFGLIIEGLRNSGFAFIALGFMEIMPYSFGRWGFKVVRLTPKDLGLISLSGVGINIILAIFFKMFPGMWLFDKLAYFNALFALFNLLPIPPLDGSKIFMWKMWLWLLLMFITILLLFVF